MRQIRLVVELIFFTIAISALIKGFESQIFLGLGFIIASVTLFAFLIELFWYQKYTRIYSQEFLLDQYIQEKLGFDYNNSELLQEHNISRDDISYLKEWYQDHAREEELRGKFWRREWLERVIPLGIDWASGYTPTLDKFLHPDILQSFSDEHFYFFSYKREIELAERILVQNGRNNVLLIGEEGGGSRFVLEGLGRLIQRGRALPALAFKRFCWLDTEAVLSGIKTSGELRERLEAIFSETIEAGNIVLAIERIHALFDPTFPEIADVFLPFLQSDASQIVATTTPAFLASHLSRADIINQFARVTLEEASFRSTIFTIQETAHSLEIKERIRIPYPSLKKLIEFADRFSLDVPRPQRDINLLEEVVSYVKSKGKRVLDVLDVVEAVSERTGVPLGALHKGEEEKLLHVEEILHQKLIDQESAVKAIAGALKRARLEIRDVKRPIGSFLFLGPTGVGKTTAAKGLAQLYFGSENAMVRFDMSEYQNQTDIERLIHGLSQQVRQHPYAALLLDEIEKAHSKIFNLFLQILDEGILTDVSGFHVDFRNLIIIATSNAGAEFIRTNINRVGTQQFERDLLEHIQGMNIFSPEFLNRFDDIVTFKPLGEEELKAIARLLLSDLDAQLQKEHQITLIIGDDLISFLAQKGFDPQYGARPMRRILQDTIETTIAEKLLKGEIKKGDTLELPSAQLQQ